MTLVSEVVSNDGTLPILEELNKGGPKILTRRNGLILSLFWFLLFVLILTPVWGILDVEEMAAMTAVVGVFGSLMIFLFSLFFLRKPSKESFAQVSAFGTRSIHPGHPAGQGALPPVSGHTADEYVSPVPGSWRAPDTEDLVEPGSVTEGTTKLLQKEEPTE